MLKRDDALKTVVKFTTTIITNVNGVNKVSYSVGTGFFMHRDAVNNKLYIITACHVVNSFNPTTIVEMNGKNGIVRILLSNLQNGLQIKKHQTADVAAVEVDISVFNSLNADVKLFCTSLINPTMIANLSRDTELTCIGFPNGLGTNTSFSPLTFRSYPSSNLIKNINLSTGFTSDIFVLENPSCGGYSGGPVLDLGYIVSSLIQQSSPTYFYGLMHGTVSDDTGGKMAIVTPATYILQII